MSPTSSSDFVFPDSAIRLAAAVHRFGVPRMPETRLATKLSYVKSFSMASNCKPKTQQVMIKADAFRSSLSEALKSTQHLSYSRVVQESQRYAPVVYQILLSCKLQPEQAQLDVPLVFEWQSGIEQSPRPFSSNTLMYELVMTVVCEGLGRAGSAADSSMVGEYTAASQDFAKAAGIFHYLATHLMPTWTDKGVSQEMLPTECDVAMVQAMEKLFLVNEQQMAVATMMVRKGAASNLSLLSKLCFGTLQQWEAYMSQMRKDGKIGMTRMDKDFFLLVTIQMAFYKSLTYYVQAQDLWAKHEHGVAVALLRDSILELKTRDGPTSAGIPDLSKVPSLAGVSKDLRDFRAHQEELFKGWKQDNSSIFFERVPAQVPTDVRLQEGENIAKCEPFKLEVTEPIQLKLTCDKNSILRDMTRSANRHGLV